MLMGQSSTYLALEYPKIAVWNNSIAEKVHSNNLDHNFRQNA